MPKKLYLRYHRRCYALRAYGGVNRLRAFRIVMTDGSKSKSISYNSIVIGMSVCQLKFVLYGVEGFHDIFRLDCRKGDCSKFVMSTRKHETSKAAGKPLSERESGELYYIVIVQSEAEIRISDHSTDRD